jgi:hypothetical protein
MKVAKDQLCTFFGLPCSDIEGSETYKFIMHVSSRKMASNSNAYSNHLEFFIHDFYSKTKIMYFTILSILDTSSI